MTRSGAAADHVGYFHETAFYGSDEELLALVVPFVEEGRGGGEPTLVTFNDRNAALLRDALAQLDGISFRPAADQYARPAVTIASYRELLAGYVAAGAAQIRVVGDVPHPGTGADWNGWLRYEAAVNEALADFPLWGLCPYDTRITPDDVLADVERLHPHVATADGGHHRNERYTDPTAYVGARARAAANPMHGVAPAFALDDVASAAAVRRALRGVAAETLLDPARVDDLVLAASEIVTNAIRYGRAPVDLRVWFDAERVVCQVRDLGEGPRNPLVGLMPASAGGEGGYGLWLAHQLCDRVDLDRHDDGFAVRLVVDQRAPTLT
jgi:anti-sigma regulatory factor (Ser/Thr protein kinase)